LTIAAPRTRRLHGRCTRSGGPPSSPTVTSRATWRAVRASLGVIQLTTPHAL
jgi:hypothetical protein